MQYLTTHCLKEIYGIGKLHFMHFMNGSDKNKIPNTNFTFINKNVPKVLMGKAA